MSVAKTIELTSTSREGFEAAIRDAIAKASETVRNIEGAWVKEQKVLVSDGQVTGFRVHLEVTFVLDEPRPNGVAQAGGSGPTPVAPGQGGRRSITPKTPGLAGVFERYRIPDSNRCYRRERAAS